MSKDGTYSLTYNYLMLHLLIFVVNALFTAKVILTSNFGMFFADAVQLGRGSEGPLFGF